MAVQDFTGKNIQDTYQRVVQTDGTNLRDGTGSLLPISFDGNNVVISGSLTATEYSVTSSVTNVVFQQQSGSTIFGDSLDDIHQITGSLVVTASIEAATLITAPLINATSTFAGSLIGSATGLSGTPSISVNQITASGDLLFTDGNDVNITTQNGLIVNLEQGDSGDSTFFKVRNIQQDNDLFTINDLGQIIVGIDDCLFSSRGDLQLITDVNNTNTNNSFIFKNHSTTLATLHESDGFDIETNITASGNISSSGDLIVNNIIGNIDGGTF